MIIEMPQSHGANLAFEVVGKVSSDQEKQWIEKIDQAVNIHGNINILVLLSDDARWGLKAGFDDMKWILSHVKHIDKVAIVSSSDVWKWLVTVDSFFAQLVGVEEKYFELAHLDDAFEWLKNEDAN